MEHRALDIGHKTYDKAKKTKETIDVHKQIVVCNKCGSTRIGLRGKGTPNEVVCDSCHNAMPWDGMEFTLIDYVEHGPLDTLVEVEHAVSRTEQKARSRARKKEHV